VQWGKPVGRHEAITHKLADMAANTYAMESMARVTTWMADQGNFDIRLEAAASKEWNTARTWEIVDDTMQIRGGRGYETESSLAGRGESPVGVERMMRDYRINKIFEGSSEIMHLFMAREAVDKHLEVAGALIDPKKSTAEKLQAFVGTIPFYGTWYPEPLAGLGALAALRRVRRAAPPPALRRAQHAQAVARDLPRHGGAPGAAAEQAGVPLPRVDVANELFAMAASVTRSHALTRHRRRRGGERRALADLFCRSARRKVRRLFRDLWSNDDARKYAVGKAVLDGRPPLAQRSCSPGSTSWGRAAAARAGAGARAGGYAVAVAARGGLPRNGHRPGRRRRTTRVSADGKVTAARAGGRRRRWCRRRSVSERRTAAFGELLARFARPPRPRTG
jgi:hypothetical protein